ncbi:MAG: zinc-binding dehydrogenase, partial [Clostridia bacterium]|nr:zinc-binding dehydrogenase [Clostridia bacterium]
ESKEVIVPFPVKHLGEELLVTVPQKGDKKKLLELSKLNVPDYTRKGGKIIFYGIPGDNDTVNLPVKKLIVEEMTIYGAVGNTKAWYPLVDMIAAGKLDIGQLVTHRFKLEDINKAFDLYRNHDPELIKAVIEF